MIVHAGLIASFQDTLWRGVLIEGPSGSGKSDLAVRAMRCGFRLVADDRVLLFRSHGRLFGRAPASLAGLLEVRGVGVSRVGALRIVEVALVIVCTAREQIERTPEIKHHTILGFDIPSVALCPFESSAPAKLCRALAVLGSAGQQDYDAAFPRPAQRLST